MGSKTQSIIAYLFSLIIMTFRSLSFVIRVKNTRLKSSTQNWYLTTYQKLKRMVKSNIFSCILLLIILFAAGLACKGQHLSEEQKNVSNPSKHEVNQLPSSVWSIHHDALGNYWYGSNGEGIFMYDGNILTNYTSKDGLAGDQIRDIQEDHLGNIYFDTPTGISKYDGNTFTTLEPIYSPMNVWKKEPTDLWFKLSGDFNGVFRYDGESLFHLPFPKKDLKKTLGFIERQNTYSPYGIYSIYTDKQENLWFGTLAAGVYRFDGTSFLWIGEKELSRLEDGRVPGVRSIIEDKDGNYWLSNILNRYKLTTIKDTLGYDKLAGIDQSYSLTKMELPYFMSAVTDSNNDLWLLTYAEGIWKYDGVNFYNYPIRDGETHVMLFAMYMDNNETIWLGTHDAGLFKFNGNDFEKFTF